MILLWVSFFLRDGPIFALSEAQSSARSMAMWMSVSSCHGPLLAEVVKVDILYTTTNELTHKYSLVRLDMRMNLQFIISSAAE